MSWHSETKDDEEKKGKGNEQFRQETIECSYIAKV